MDKICKNCKWWDREYNSDYIEEQPCKRIINNTFATNNDISVIGDNLDFEHILFSGYFGCIHFEEK
jgi:hypothetical protein